MKIYRTTVGFWRNGLAPHPDTPDNEGNEWVMCGSSCTNEMKPGDNVVTVIILWFWVKEE